MLVVIARRRRFSGACVSTMRGEYVAGIVGRGVYATAEERKALHANEQGILTFSRRELARPCGPQTFWVRLECFEEGGVADGRGLGRICQYEGPIDTLLGSVGANPALLNC